MALMQASAMAVFRSSMRSSGKPISFATLAAVPMATFSYPMREGTRSSTGLPFKLTMWSSLVRLHGLLSQEVQVQSYHLPDVRRRKNRAIPATDESRIAALSSKLHP